MRKGISSLIAILLLANSLMAQIEVGVAKGNSIAICPGVGTDFIENISGWNVDVFAEKKYEVIAIQAKFFYLNLGQINQMDDNSDGYSSYHVISHTASYSPLISAGIQASLKVYLFSDHYYLSVGAGLISSRNVNYATQTIASHGYFPNPVIIDTTTSLYQSGFTTGTAFCIGNGVRLPLPYGFAVTIDVSYQFQTVEPLLKYASYTGSKTVEVPSARQRIGIGICSISAGINYTIAKRSKK